MVCTVPSGRDTGWRNVTGLWSAERHKLVRLQFESTDVIHSWWWPAISGKRCGAWIHQLSRAENRPARDVERGMRRAMRAAAIAHMQIIVTAKDARTEYDKW